MIRIDALYEEMEHGNDEDVRALVELAKTLDGMIKASNGLASYDQIYELLTDNECTTLMRVDHEFGDGAADIVIMESAPGYAREVHEHRKRRMREDQILLKGGQALRALT